MFDTVYPAFSMGIPLYFAIAGQPDQMMRPPKTPILPLLGVFASHPIPGKMSIFQWKAHSSRWISRTLSNPSMEFPAFPGFRRNAAVKLRWPSSPTWGPNRLVFFVLNNILNKSLFCGRRPIMSVGLLWWLITLFICPFTQRDYVRQPRLLPSLASPAAVPLAIRQAPRQTLHPAIR